MHPPFVDSDARFPDEASSKGMVHPRMGASWSSPSKDDTVAMRRVTGATSGSLDAASV